MHARLDLPKEQKSRRRRPQGFEQRRSRAATRARAAAQDRPALGRVRQRRQRVLVGRLAIVCAAVPIIVELVRVALLWILIVLPIVPHPRVLLPAGGPRRPRPPGRPRHVAEAHELDVGENEGGLVGGGQGERAVLVPQRLPLQQVNDRAPHRRERGRRGRLEADLREVEGGVEGVR